MEEIKKLAQMVDFVPDVIVGVARGGIVPARLLSTLLNVKRVHCITVERMGEVRTVVGEIGEDLKGKKVLLVEDMLETGKSMDAALDYLASKHAETKTICLYVMPDSSTKPDYFLREVNRVVEFPWE
jgi:hypoxanthine phosphoribosyltransferase